MANKRLRMTVEFSVDENVLAEKGLTVSDVVNGIRFYEHDAIDGFEITTNIPGCDCTSDFFLCGGDVVKVEEIDSSVINKFVNNEKCGLALFEYLKEAGKIGGSNVDRWRIIHDINNLRGREWLELVDRNVATKPFFEYILGAEYPWDEFAYGSGIAPDVFLKAVLNKEFPENVGFDDVREALDKNGFEELWDFPVDEIDDVLENLSDDLRLLAVDFYEDNGHFARVFEITQDMADRFESFLVETERGDTVLPCHVRPDDRIVGPYIKSGGFDYIGCDNVDKLISDAGSKCEMMNNAAVNKNDIEFGKE